MENSKETAFPMVVDATKHTEWHSGLTKREYFAAMFIQGIISNDVMGRHLKSVVIVRDGLAIADELLKQIEK